MLHPLIRLLATQPELLGDHAQAYGELIGDGLAAQAQALKQRTLLLALAICFLGVAAVLTGVSVLLWASAVAAPTLALVWVPLTPAILALICLVLLHRLDSTHTAAFAELRRQLQADMAMLRQLGDA